VTPPAKTSAPLTPTAEIVQSYVRKWVTLERYVFQEKALALLFQQLCPRSDEIIHVLLKVSALNDFYSTNIYDTHTVAKHIVALKDCRNNFREMLSRIEAGEMLTG